MKCPSCNSDNKENARNCRKCGTSLVIQPIWAPTWQWHAKTLGIIYVCLIILFFVLNHALKPYMRNIPPEVTPWLHQAEQIHK